MNNNIDITTLTFEEKLNLLEQLCNDETFPIFYNDSDEGYCPAQSPSPAVIDFRVGKNYVKINCVLI